MGIKITQKKWSNAQRFGRLEKVVSQLFVAVADLEQRLAKLDGGIDINDKNEENEKSK